MENICNPLFYYCVGIILNHRVVDSLSTYTVQFANRTPETTRDGLCEQRFLRPGRRAAGQNVGSIDQHSTRALGRQNTVRCLYNKVKRERGRSIQLEIDWGSREIEIYTPGHYAAGQSQSIDDRDSWTHGVYIYKMY